MTKAKSRAKQFQDPDEQIANDYDPEDNAPDSPHGSDGDDSQDEKAGTEHYVSVGKSKLRKKEDASLGPAYRGAHVSRSKLYENSDDNDDDDNEGSESDEGVEYDDPETANLAVDTAEASDSEIDSDNALAESDAERLRGFTFRGSSKPAKAKGKSGNRATAADFMSSSDESDNAGGVNVDDDELDGALTDDSDDETGTDEGSSKGANSDNAEDSEEEEEDDDDEDEYGDDGESGDEEGEDEHVDDSDDESDGDDESPTSKNSQDAKPHLAAFSKQADVAKGKAIHQQRKAYDGLLNLRIRLQKALVAANTFPTLEMLPDADSEPYEAAEEAAIKLLNTISSLRENFGATSKKRKRPLEMSMDSEAIWEQMQEEGLAAVEFREDRLEKWSRKVQSVNVTAPARLGQGRRTMVEVLQGQLANPERLLQRTRVPRSCAPAQAAKKATEDEAIYDDADFYQLLLKELVDQRTVDAGSSQASAVPTVMLTAVKEVKVRKQVDRKASKGRKMRFTVHEKLQNLMAPENRASWEEQAVDRFFGTLFGRKMALDEEESSEDEAMEGLDAEEEGLRLFRN
ncbi:protein BFR2 [Drechmeria coniospora]|uniref:Protein BFR2 n=1 Tax=Drechmeria coniospora TaxID=98403 RepID=A0A151GDN4_DRECN|nr:protein BFR2 [Drechmeria coniospora]KYK55195.1 protein BFR2 [Drechmeria coniospora]ODA82181.1 hypothetical protein RJ55_00687 [Drechmeria coniospora]